MRSHKVMLQILGEYLVENICLVAPRSRSNRIEKFSTWVYKHEFGLEQYLMARKKGGRVENAGAGVSADGGKLQWLNIRFDPEDIESVVDLAKSLDEFKDALVELITGGGDFSVRYEPKDSGYVCFLSDARADAANGGLALSARAGTPIHAVCAAIVKLRIYKSHPERFTTAGQAMGIR